MKRLSCVFLGVCIAPNLFANQELVFNGEAKASYLYNSALSVDELDQVNTQGDNGIQFDGSLAATWTPTDTFKLTTGLGYSNSQYSELEQFDLTLYRFNIDGSYALENRDIGIRIDNVEAHLQGNKFLSFQQVSAYTGQFLTATTFLRTSVNYKNKTFPDLSPRDATSLGLSGDLFHFINDAKTMLSANINIEKEQATDKQFDFTGLGLKTRISHKFTWLGLDNKAGLSWKYQIKNHPKVEISEAQDQSFFEPGSPAQIIERDQYRSVTTADWELNITNNVSIKTEVEYGNYNANLAQLDYQQTKVNLSISARF
ncbi:hypothetical protein [Paraglaciecola sp. 2405UD69-4]|uniref:hypothetical protein n=1 Tax=Paraglaciecola sp. 2405UD69-4 TaxID=3391836 RepID=UPI0039C9B85C